MASGSSAKLELTANQIILIFAVSLLIILVYLAYVYLPRPVYNADYYGIPLTFRADLNEADKVPVYPNEGYLYYELRGGLAKNITIAFVPIEGGNDIYSAEGFEVTYKLSLMFSLLGMNVTINAMNVTNYANLPGKIQNPIIALVHPKFSNETAVRLDGHVIHISGLPSNDVTPYRNLDLATVKFLMVVLGIIRDKNL